jgi:branched-chain amino acid transport system permease protein
MSQLLQYLIDSLTFGSLYAVAALGIALIFGVAKIANFAHGELIMISSYVLLLLSGVHWAIGAFAVLLSGVLLAVAMERSVFRPVRDADPTTLLVVSFAASVLLQNLVILFLTAESRPTRFGYSLLQPVNIGSVSMSRLSIVTIGVTLTLLIALALFLKKTPIGVQLRAASEDFTMARMVGVKANTVVATAFALSGLLAAIAGLLLAAQNGLLVPQLGFQPVLIAFVATIIGGMGSISGAVAGGFVVGAITGLLGVALPEHLQPYRDSFVFGGVILMLLLRPQGLFPPAAVEERV